MKSWTFHTARSLPVYMRHGRANSGASTTPASSPARGIGGPGARTSLRSEAQGERARAGPAIGRGELPDADPSHPGHQVRGVPHRDARASAVLLHSRSEEHTSELQSRSD